MKHASLLRDPDGYIAKWPEELYREEAERFYAWLKARRSYSPNSLARYLAAFKSLLGKLGKHPREISYEDVLRLRPSSDEARALKLYLKFLSEITEEERWEKLYKRVRVPRPKESLPEVLSSEQVEKLLEACGRISFELKVLVAVVYETGARIHEILLLRGRDVELDQCGARLYIRKSKSVPKVVRLALYASLLASWLEARKPAPDGPIFPHEYNTYKRWLKKAWRLAGLPPRSGFSTYFGTLAQRNC